MTEKFITSNLRVQQAKQLVDSLSGANTSIEYYSFVGNHVTYPSGDSVIPVPNDSIDCISSNVYQNMIFGKKIDDSDVSFMIRNVPWESNTVYTMYEHDNPTLLSNDFFTIVSEGSYYYVYKCLFNNGDSPSTVQPTFASSTQETDLFDSDDGYYRTSDGYQWKYLYTIPSATYTKFATSEYAPVVVNTAVTAAAVNGAIDVIKVESGGARYDNFFSSIFGEGDLRVTANIVGLSAYTNRMYSLGSNRSTSNIAGSIAVTNGQLNVVGTSTSFTTALDVGDYIKIQNSTASEIRKISSITNNTLLTVSTSWTNSFSGANASITYPFEANDANDFYNYCILKIVAGTGSGQYRTINDFVNDGAKKIVILDSEFSTPPDTTSRYEISPGIAIYGSGTETVNAVGRALINSSSSNSVYAIEMLSRGEGYMKATANVTVASPVGVTAVANLKPIISPPKGHGADITNELGAYAVGISIQFQNNESSRITTDNDYRQIGIIKNPSFANVELNIVQPGNSGVAGGEGSFLENETIRQFTMVQINGTVSINTTSSNVVATNTDLTESVAVADAIVVKSGNNWFTANVSSITNSTHMVLTTNGVFVNTAAYFYKANLLASAEILTVSAGLMYVSTNTGTFTSGKKIIGLDSYAVANVANVQINNEDVSSGINTFRQMTYYTGTKTGTFTADETIYQTTANNRSAKFHSSNNISGTDYLYVTNQFGIFDAGATLVGETSNAVFTITNKYNGDVHPQSGEIVYLQNGSAISRSNTQTEKIKIVIEY